MTVIEIRDGELMKTLSAELAEAGITDAGLVLIGGVDAFTISNMPADDATRDIVTTYDQPGEMHGTGEVVGGAVHVHATFGVEGNIARAGHVHSAQVGTWFVRVRVLA